MNKFKNFSFYFVFGFAALSVGYLLGFWTNFYYLSYKYNPVRLSNERALKDIHGGKTPEETYGSFVSALKQENIELASKYFVLGKQDEELEEFEKIKEKGELAKYTNDLPEWGEMKQLNVFNDGKIKEYGRDVFKKERIINIQGSEFKLPAGERTQSISFRLNPTTHIWKIERL